MSKYIYDLPLTDWAINFAYQTDIENELDNHKITMSGLRRQFHINGKILKYSVTTSNLGRKYLTLDVEITINKNEKRLQQFRLYSPFIPQKLKKLEDLIGKKIESISPLCTIRHRRSDDPIIILTSTRIKISDGIIIVRTSLQEDESHLLTSSPARFGSLTKSQSELKGLTEKDILSYWYKDEDGFNAIVDKSIKRKYNISDKDFKQIS